MTAISTKPFSNRSEDAPFEMANLRPQTTGLPFVVWISQQGSAQHDVRIKLSRTPKAGPDWMTVAVRPDVRDLSGQLSGAELEQVRRWVELNRDTLVRFWDGDIAYTEDVLPMIRRVDA
jgi:hypothetical protein